MQKKVLKLQNINKSYDAKDNRLEVLKDLSLDVYEHEVICLLGHSGCGKTTLLRIICGMEEKDSGLIYLDDKEVTKPTKDIIMLFQSFNQLLPWKTVLNNIVHPMLATKTMTDKKEAKEFAKKCLADVGLGEFINSYPNQLSGGMKQRAAIVRALGVSPKVLVMDEPFASLDYSTRRKLQKITKTRCKMNKTTVVFVTHDVEEAIIMADRIAIMDTKSRKIETIIDNRYQITNDERDKVDLMTQIFGILASKENTDEG